MTIPMKNNPRGHGRHPSTQHLINILTPNPNLNDPKARRISHKVYELAVNMLDEVPDSPELTSGLRKLWEAKNSLVIGTMLPLPPVNYKDR